MHTTRLYNSSETIFWKLADRLEATFDTYLAGHVIRLAPQDRTPVGTPLAS